MREDELFNSIFDVIPQFLLLPLVLGYIFKSVCEKSSLHKYIPTLLVFINIVMYFLITKDDNLDGILRVSIYALASTGLQSQFKNIVEQIKLVGGNNK